MNSMIKQDFIYVLSSADAKEKGKGNGEQKTPFTVEKTLKLN